MPEAKLFAAWFLNKRPFLFIENAPAARGQACQLWKAINIENRGWHAQNGTPEIFKNIFTWTAFVQVPPLKWLAI